MNGIKSLTGCLQAPSSIESSMDQARRECSGPSNGPGAEVGYDFVVLLDMIAVTQPDLTPI